MIRLTYTTISNGYSMYMDFPMQDLLDQKSISGSCQYFCDAHFLGAL